MRDVPIYVRYDASLAAIVRNFAAAWLSCVDVSGLLGSRLLVACSKLTKSWVRLPKSRLIRGCERRVRRRNLEKGFQAHLSSTRGGCSNEADIIQNDLRAGGEAVKGGGKETI